MGYKESRGLNVLYSFKDLSNKNYRDYSSRIVDTNIRGLNKALLLRCSKQLREAFEEMNPHPELQPFFLEGIGMAAAISDNFMPRFIPLLKRDLLSDLLQDFGSGHQEFILRGAGRGLAEIPPFNLYSIVEKYPPSVRWFIIDGYGFQRGYFSIPKNRSSYNSPNFRYPYFERAYAQGLAGCLGFYLADQPHLATEYIKRMSGFDPYDLWSGLGSTVALLGAMDLESYLIWLNSDSSLKPYLATGIAFAARLLIPAGFNYQHLDEYAKNVWGLTAKDLAHRILGLQEYLKSSKMIDQSLYDINTDYQILRDTVLEEFINGSRLKNFTDRSGSD